MYGSCMDHIWSIYDMIWYDMMWSMCFVFSIHSVIRYTCIYDIYIYWYIDIWYMYVSLLCSFLFGRTATQSSRSTRAMQLAARSIVSAIPAASSWAANPRVAAWLWRNGNQLDVFFQRWWKLGYAKWVMYGNVVNPMMNFLEKILYRWVVKTIFKIVGPHKLDALAPTMEIEVEMGIVQIGWSELGMNANLQQIGSSSFGASLQERESCWRCFCLSFWLSNINSVEGLFLLQPEKWN